MDHLRLCPSPITAAEVSATLPFAPACPGVPWERSRKPALSEGDLQFSGPLMENAFRQTAPQ